MNLFFLSEQYKEVHKIGVKKIGVKKEIELCLYYTSQHYGKTSWKGKVVTGTALHMTHCHQVVGYIPWQQGLSLSYAD